jgi:outer membrane receptor protein involved in Fe transport
MVYASGFIRDTKDKIVQRINPRLNDAVQTNPYENLGSTKSIGFEAEVNYTHSKQLNLLVNLSKFNSVFNQQLDPNGNQYIYYNQQLPNEPFFTINTLTNYQLEDVFGSSANLTLNHSFNFVDRFYTTWLQIEDFRTPRQFVHDLGMTYRASNEKWVVSIDARNIFNKQVYDNFAVQKPGRALYFKITYLLSTI